MNFGVIFRIASGFGFLAVSRSMEARGDVSVLLDDRQSALNFHLAALFMLVLALICFVTGGLGIFRGSKKTPASQKSGATYSSIANADLRSEFDADAALARYLENKAEETSEPETPEPPRPPQSPRPGFGRKSS